MLYEITKELDTALQAQGVPLRVVFGPERTAPVTSAAERIVVQHAEGGGADSFGPPMVPGGNPRPQALRRCGAVARIYAQSTLAGAAVQDHRRRAEAVLDRLVVALTALGTSRRSPVELQGGGFIDLVDEQGTATRSGAVYELRFSIARAVYDTTWAGDALPETTIGSGTITSTTSVRMADGPSGADPETACGG